MISRNPALRDHFFELERKETFGEYARVYGDAITEHYENRGVVFMPHVPISFDLEFFQQLVFPQQVKKIGTANGIEKPVVRRSGSKIDVDAAHPLLMLFGNMAMAAYAQSQIASFNGQLRTGLALLFPHYWSLEEGNITWRLTETVAEGLHLDVFDRGRPVSPRFRALHRVKVFINIDTQPRRWRTSLDLPEVLNACRGRLPDELPDDLHVVNDVIDKLGVLKDLPCHSVEYPTMSAVIVNADVVVHEVVYGRRMVAAEFFCDRRDMLDPSRQSHAGLGRWLAQAGYRVAPDAAAFSAQYAHLKGSYQRIVESRDP